MSIINKFNAFDNYDTRHNKYSIQELNTDACNKTLDNSVEEHYSLKTFDSTKRALNENNSCFYTLKFLKFINNLKNDSNNETINSKFYKYVKEHILKLYNSYNKDIETYRFNNDLLSKENNNLKLSLNKYNLKEDYYKDTIDKLKKDINDLNTRLEKLSNYTSTRNKYCDNMFNYNNDNKKNTIDKFKISNNLLLEKLNDLIDKNQEIKLDFNNALSTAEQQIKTLNDENNNLNKKLKSLNESLLIYKQTIDKYFYLDENNFSLNSNIINCNSKNSNCKYKELYSDVLNNYSNLETKFDLYSQEKDTAIIDFKNQKKNDELKLIKIIDSLELEIKDVRLSNDNLNRLNNDLEKELEILNKTNKLFEDDFKFNNNRIKNIIKENAIITEQNVSSFIIIIIY